MDDQNYHQKPMQATFYPSQNDDFIMPEVISPTPTRVMPEVPSNMQDGLAHLELEARVPEYRLSASSSISSVPSPHFEPTGSNRQPATRSNAPGFTASYEHTNASAYQNLNRGHNRSPASQHAPKFSPFPKLREAGPNVPLSDEDKEEVLERARTAVLQSADPEMQLAWAQDALSWVEVASQNAARTQPEGQIARPRTPNIEHRLREDALSIVRFLADQHHPKAEFMKSMWLEFGKFGYRVDKREAFLGYKNAAQKGYARAEYRIGMQYETGNDSRKAIEHYYKGVAAGDSASHYRLGMMTLLGQHDMTQDYQRGVDLIRFAADTADENAPQGAYVYGMLLARGLPNIAIPEHFLAFDLNRAKMFIEKAAFLGFAKAQLKMAQAYELCQLGCEFEPALSLHYNALAARQGENEADMAISKWFLCGYEGVFEKNEELAFTYAKRAAMTKLATAEFAMGYFYEIGVYVAVDLQESEMWYKMASEHGNKDALGRIDSIRKNGALTKKDHEQVAISKIKSQYGSQRGVQPDRFHPKPAPMPAMDEEGTDVPDLRNVYGTVAPLRPVKTETARPVSTAPYPEDEMSHVAAYRPSAGLRPNSSGGPVADRPISAFGIRPLAHTATDHAGPGLRPATGPMRPATVMGNMPQHPIQPSGRGGPPPGGNQISSPGYPSQAPTHSQVDMGRPMDFNSSQSPSHFAQQNMNSPPNRSNYSPSPYGGRPPSQQIPRREVAQQIPRRDVAQNQWQRPERLPTMQSAPVMSGGMGNPTSVLSSQGPVYNQSQQERPDSQNSGRASQRPPPQQQRVDSRPPSIAPSAAPSSGPQGSSAPSTGPKKTGPATFEAMGIPVQKEQSECVR